MVKSKYDFKNVCTSYKQKKQRTKQNKSTKLLYNKGRVQNDSRTENKRRQRYNSNCSHKQITCSANDSRIKYKT